MTTSKLLTAPSLLLLCVMLCAAPAWAQDTGASQLQRQFEAAPIDVPPPTPEAGEDSKLSPELSRLLSGESSRTRTRGELGTPVATPVRLRARDAAAAELLAARIAGSGGTVHGRIDNVVLAALPAKLVSELAGEAEVEFIARQAQLQLFGSARPAALLAATGLEFTEARRLHARGVTGKGVKIGIIDFGFAGYQRPGLPSPQGYRRFGAASGAATISHGTACAEIIRSMAPDAALYFAEIGPDEGFFLQAAEWLASEGVNIVSFSGGSVEDRADGADALSRFVEDLSRRHSIVWVNAAGNLAERHWAGRTADADNNGWIDIDAQGRSFLTVRPTANRLDLVLKWDDWGADPNRPHAEQDLDLILYREILGIRVPVPLAESSRRRERSGEPVEMLSADVEPGKVYYVGLRAGKLTAARRVHVFVRSDAELHPAAPEGSVMSPATARSVLAVGAVDVRTRELAGYSAQGPTDDGRTKPDLVAPAEVPTAAYGAKLFGGTSAACAHVAGFAALVKQAENASGAELRAAVLRGVEPTSAPPNNRWGHGLISAAVLDAGSNPESGPGVKYNIRLLREGAVEAVDAGADFFTGDQFWLEAELERPGFLYVIHRSTSGSGFSMLYPGAGSGAARTIAPGKIVRVPGEDGQVFSMSGEPGVEKFYLVASPRAVDWSRYFQPETGKCLDASGRAVAALLSKFVEQGSTALPRERARGVDMVDTADQAGAQVVELDLIHRPR